MSTDQFFDANGILRDAGVGEEISRYMRDIQGPLNIGQDANSLKAIREEMKVWQSLDATKEIRDAMKSMQLADPTKEIREAMKSMQLADPIKEIREQMKIWESLGPPKHVLEAMKSMQLADPAKEIREAMKVWQTLDPMKNVREAMTVWQISDPTKEIREAMKYWQISDPVKEIRDAMAALRAEGWVDDISKNSWQLASNSFADDIVFREDNTISVGSTSLSSTEIQSLVDQISAKVVEQSTRQLMPIVRAIFDELASLKNPALAKWLALVIIPVVINALFSLVNPVSDYYLKAALERGSGQLSVREMKQDVRKHVAKSVERPADLDSYRFVSTKNLEVRTNPAVKSPILGNLHFGQVLVLVEKRKAWSLVAWSDDDGNIALQGWVFSRYVSKFK